MSDDNVIDLEAHKEVWLTGRVVCVNCAYLCIGVAHSDMQNRLECPECGEMKMVLMSVDNSAGED